MDELPDVFGAWAVRFRRVIYSMKRIVRGYVLVRGKSRFSMVDLPVCLAPVGRTHLKVFAECSTYRSMARGM